MYLTSFVQRDRLFNIAERWFCGRPQPADARSLTEILMCDVFIIRETLHSLSRRLLNIAGASHVRQKDIRRKGELRDLICCDSRQPTLRIAELFNRYRKNPDYYYRETPINASVFFDDRGQMLGSYRVKRPKRIAEKANRRIADWIFGNVKDVAESMARERAQRSGVPLEHFVTPPHEMEKEFIAAEELIAAQFRNGTSRFDRDALTIHDTGAIKIVGDEDMLERLARELHSVPDITVLEQEQFSGNFQAMKVVLELPWEAEAVCRRYSEDRAWEKNRERGIPQEELCKGLEPLLEGASPTISIEVILTTFADLVESELGNSIHEERIISQRDSSRYRGNIPMNVEFLVEFLFAVGFSPRISLEDVPIKIWGRYLPETLGSYIRQLYSLPDHDFFA
ncbi:MAG TPA: hypothetical protein VEI28_01565 [Thermodesulfovibrionales bacterium]|nr:hypothetical protein [Thermodesulfovibrionales bacterium]